MADEKKEKKLFKVVEVATQMGQAIETPEGKVIGQDQLLVDMANELRAVKEAVA